jgi:hypothetical protein
LVVNNLCTLVIDVGHFQPLEFIVVVKGDDKHFLSLDAEAQIPIVHFIFIRTIGMYGQYLISKMVVILNHKFKQSAVLSRNPQPKAAEKYTEYHKMKY